MCIVWVGYWILNSRTRLEGDVITQTWLWDKREDAADVAQLKLVHSRWLERIIAPRLLVRRRNGGVTWIHSADARLLTDSGAGRSAPASRHAVTFPLTGRPAGAPARTKSPAVSDRAFVCSRLGDRGRLQLLLLHEAVEGAFGEAEPRVLVGQELRVVGVDLLPLRIAAFSSL